MLVVLVLAACTPPAPTATPAAATPTGAAPLTSPPSPAGTQTAPTGAPATASPARTAAPTSAAPPATPTASAAAAAVPTATAPALPCLVLPVRAFGKVYTDNPNVARALGCAREAEKAMLLAEQPFQKGFMYWRSDSRQIHAIMDTGLWVAFPDTWNEGDPSPSLGTPVPAGLVEPGRGFGKVWRDRPEVRDGLGWATNREQGYDGFVQAFTNGTMIWSDRRMTWVLFSDGTWLRFADTT